MPNKRGRPKRLPDDYKQIKGTFTFDTQEQLDDIKRWGGSSWIRQKWQERKLAEEEIMEPKTKKGRQTQWDSELGPTKAGRKENLPQFYKNGVVTELAEEKGKRDES